MFFVIICMQTKVTESIYLFKIFESESLRNMIGAQMNVALQLFFNFFFDLYKLPKLKKNVKHKFNTSREITSPAFRHFSNYKQIPKQVISTRLVTTSPKTLFDLT